MRYSQSKQLFPHVPVMIYFEMRMCQGTFLRLARSLATIYIFTRMHVIGMLVPFEIHLISSFRTH